MKYGCQKLIDSLLIFVPDQTPHETGLPETEMGIAP